jgi:hypothetical protein
MKPLASAHYNSSEVQDAGCAVSPIEQMLAELETQTRCMDNAIGSLEGRLSSVLGPVPPRPADGAQPPPCASGYSQLRDRIKAFAEITQMLTSRINGISERVEC